MSDLANSTADAPGIGRQRLRDRGALGTGPRAEAGRHRLLRPIRRLLRRGAKGWSADGLMPQGAFRQACRSASLINLDMIGHPADRPHPRHHRRARPWANDMPADDRRVPGVRRPDGPAATMYTTVAPQLGRSTTADYMPFEHFGYPVIGPSTGRRSAVYHSVTDTPDKVSRATTPRWSAWCWRPCSPWRTIDV